MKQTGFWRVGGAATALWLSFVLAGCGGGGEGDDSDAPPNEGKPLAAEQVSGQVLSLSAGATNRQITFAPSGAGWTENDGQKGGSYVYQRSGANTAELVLNSDGQQTVIVLEFQSDRLGIYRVTTPEGGEGTFELSPAPEPAPTPPPVENPPEGGGAPPASLSGRTMYGTRTYTSTGPVGQTHVYTFSKDTFHDSDPPEESDGYYTWQVSGDRAALLLNYTAPKGFNGDRHELAMTFFAPDRGAFTSTYTRRDGTVIQIDGTFQLE